MSAIIRGTTPRIKYAFSSLDARDITVALLKIKQEGQAIVEKELADADTVTANSIEWVLSQEDTLKLAPKKYAYISLDWLLDDDTRGAGVTEPVNVISSGTDEVLENE